MEITTLVGLIVAMIGLLGGMYFKGVPFSALANPAAIFIILVGTVGTILNAFPMSDIKKVGSIFKLVFFNQKSMSNIETVNVLMNYAQMARKDGMLSLESKVDAAPTPFIKRGLSLLMAGLSSEDVFEILAEENAEMEKRHAANAAVFSQAGTYAPTLGVLGAVIGLVAALSNMGDTEKLGHAISAAFIATMYGIFTGYVLWHPFANKLKRKSKYEVLTNEIVIEGILCLANGDSPVVLEEKVLSYLTKAEKKAYLAQKGK